MRLLAVVVGTLSREERTGLEGLPDGRLLGSNAGPEKNAVGPVGKTVFGEGYPVALVMRWDGELLTDVQPGAHVEVGFSSVAWRGPGKCAGSERVEDSLLVQRNSGGGETPLRPPGETFSGRLGGVVQD